MAEKSRGKSKGSCVKGFRRVGDWEGKFVQADKRRKKAYGKQAWPKIPERLNAGVSSQSIAANHYKYATEAVLFSV